MIFYEATTAMLAGMGFERGKGITTLVGGHARFGYVEGHEWVGVGVLVTPVRAYRDHRRAEDFARTAHDFHPAPTGRRFIRPMACRDGRPVFVVMLERYTDQEA